MTLMTQQEVFETPVRRAFFCCSQDLQRGCCVLEVDCRQFLCDSGTNKLLEEEETRRWRKQRSLEIHGQRDRSRSSTPNTTTVCWEFRSATALCRPPLSLFLNRTLALHALLITFHSSQNSNNKRPLGPQRGERELGKDCHRRL
jgi:hypothetical protein